MRQFSKSHEVIFAMLKSKAPTNLSVIKYQSEQLSSLFSLFITAILMALFLYTLSKLYHPVTDLSAVKKVFELDSMSFRPEPLERLQFVSGILILPFFLLLSHFFANKVITIKRPDIIHYTYSFLFPVLLVLLITWLTIHPNALVYTAINYEITPVSFVFLFLLSLFVFNRMTTYDVSSIEGWKSEILGSLLELLFFLSTLLVFLYGIMALNGITNSPIYIYSFNAVFHAVVQVFLGKELLVDLIHQYGLYPHVIEPVFRILGLSVLSFSILMAFLNVLAILCIYLFLKKVVRNRFIVPLTLVAMLFFCYFFGRIVNFQEYYYQYHPVRFIFPAISILLSYIYLKSRSNKLYYFSHFLYSTAVLWNFDTGLVVFLSWLLLLIYIESPSMCIAPVLNQLVTSLTSLAIVSMLFCLYMKIRYGYFPDFSWALEYQKLFYINGYFMLPMKMWHPWMVVMFIHAAGLFEGLKSLLRKDVTTRSAMFLYLAILGTGLFSYFQGRSHDLNLPAVSYPAIIMLAMYIDGLVEKVKSYGVAADKIFLIMLLFLLIYINVSFACSIPEIASTIRQRVGPVFTKERGLVYREFDFIRANVTPGEEVLILTQLSGVHSLAALSPCPLKISGATELILKSDYRKISDYIKTRAKKVIADRYYSELVRKTNSDMQISLVNLDNTIFIFTRE